MAKQPNRRHVVPTPDGWAVKAPGSSRASSKHSTQAEAIANARKIVHNAGGGEVTIHRPDGKIRNSDTVHPGNDPHPPKDKR